jgi:hypothetical protein
MLAAVEETLDERGVPATATAYFAAFLSLAQATPLADASPAAATALFSLLSTVLPAYAPSLQAHQCLCVCVSVCVCVCVWKCRACTGHTVPCRPYPDHE